jgi:hypothetical protein
MGVDRKHVLDLSLTGFDPTRTSGKPSNGYEFTS